MATRLEVQALLAGLDGVTAAYFQPPESIAMTYPCIVYNQYFRTAEFADNQPYLRNVRYRITVIDKDPDSTIPDQVAELPMSTFVRHFTVDNLYHNIFDVYF